MIRHLRYDKIFSRSFSSVEGANAYKLLLGDDVSRPAPDRSSLQKVYYNFARRNHPDVKPSSLSMSDGNAAYMLLRDVSDDQRQKSLDRLFDKELNGRCVQCDASNQSRSLPWETKEMLKETPEEYRAFLESLDGTDSLRFHRSWVDASGRRYRGIEAKNDFRRPINESGASSNGAGQTLFFVFCFLLYCFESLR